MDWQLIILIVPLVVVVIVWRVFLLRDLARRQDVVGGSKWCWAAAILFGGTLGRLAYILFLAERKNDLQTTPGERIVPPAGEGACISP